MTCQLRSVAASYMSRLDFEIREERNDFATPETEEMQLVIALRSALMCDESRDHGRRYDIE